MIFWNDEDERWNEIDELIYKGDRLGAILLLRERMRQEPILYQLDEQTYFRKERLKILYPERFRVFPYIPPLERAEKRFVEVQEPILAIEALWDGDDSTYGYLRLYAIVEGPSKKHSKFTEIYLGGVDAGDLPENSPLETLIEFTKTIGQQFAARAGVAYFPPVADVDYYAPRWWDSQPS